MAPSSQTPGWAAVEEPFRVLYGAEPPDHRALPRGHRPPAEGAVLHGISAYRAQDHWHLVTFGLSDVVAKTAGDPPGVSRFGHELTLMTPPAERAPDWAFALLLGTARVCLATGRSFHAGARLAPGAPVDGGASKLVALGLRADPLATPAAFPHGRFTFLQAVGVTEMEFRLMRRAGTLVVLEKLAARDPLLRTDPERG